MAGWSGPRATLRRRMLLLAPSLARFTTSTRGLTRQPRRLACAWAAPGWAPSSTPPALTRPWRGSPGASRGANWTSSWLRARSRRS
eukprot:3619294-Alexandrium_andersonii.AAC.1